MTGYKIDIKSETQAIESGELPADYMEQMEMMDEEGYVGEYEEYEYAPEDSEAYDAYEEEDADIGVYEEEESDIEFVETEDAES